MDGGARILGARHHVNPGFVRSKPFAAPSRACAATFAILAALVGVLAAIGAGSTRARHDPGRVALIPAGLESCWVNEPAPTSDCISCHQSSAMFMHPVGVAPSMPVPAHLPLEQGRVTCATCHEVDDAHNGTARGDARVRATVAAADFCTQCHAQSGTTPHASEAILAHLATGPRLKSGAAAPRGSGAGFDSESLSCMGCHDGSVARDAGTHASIAGRSTPALEHPIGVPYRATARSRGEPDAVRLVAAASLDRRIRLFEGAVGCGSCHSIYANTESLLVKSNVRSGLCLSCHAQ